jgi:transcriptional regulator with XRE-family HTH domain
MKVFNPKSLVELTERFPPFVVRALARHPYRPGEDRDRRGMSIEEIASRSGLAVRSVGRLASKLSFRDEKLYVVDAFCRACNFNFFKTGRQFDFIRQTVIAKNRKFSHLSIRELRIFNRKCEEWQKLKQAEAASRNQS